MKSPAGQLEAANRLFVQVDPMGLVAEGAPDNETKLEAEHFLRRRRTGNAEQIQSAYLKWSGVRIRDQDAELLSEGIARLRGD